MIAGFSHWTWIVSLIARFISACLHKIKILAQPFPTVNLPPIPLLCCAFRRLSWVSASLDGLICLPTQRSREEKRREKRERVGGVFPPAVLPVWFLGWVLVGRFGRGVCPSSVACPCCFSLAFCSLGCAPGGCCSLGCCGGLSFSVRRLLSGNLPTQNAPCLAWVLVAPGRPLPVPRLCLALSLFYYIIFNW